MAGATSVSTSNAPDAGTTQYATPVRRPVAPAYDLEADDSGVIWTATRCQRLLRPLTSRIAILRGDPTRKRSRVAGRSARHVQLQTSKEGAPSILPSSTEQNDDDPDWAPGRPAKRVKRTYSNKGSDGGVRRGRTLRKHDSAHQSRSSHAIGTPRIQVPRAFIRPQSADPPEADAKSEGAKASKQDGGAEERDKLRVQELNKIRLQELSEEGRQRLARRERIGSNRQDEQFWTAMFNAIGTLLKASGSQAETPLDTRTERRGTRSLFATCLRKVPYQMIAEQSAIDGDEEADYEDVAAETYADLESMSQAPQNGWGPLRIVVRAHASALIAEAVRGGLIPFDQARMMYVAFHTNGCQEGSTDIIKAICDRTQAIGDAENDYGYDWYIVQEFLEPAFPAPRSARDKIHWQFVRESIVRGECDAAWLGSSVRQGLWSQAVDPIFAHEGVEDERAAIELVKTLFVGCVDPDRVDLDAEVHSLRLKSHQRRNVRLEQDATSAQSTERGQRAKSPETSNGWPQTSDRKDMCEQRGALEMLTAMLAYICTIHILRNDAENPAIPVMHELVQETERSLDFAVFERVRTIREAIALMPWIALITSQAYDSKPLEVFHNSKVFERIFDNRPNGDKMIVWFGQLVGSIALSCGTASRVDSEAHFEKMAKHLLALSRRGKSTSFARVAVEAGFYFAERSYNRARPDLALEIEEEAESIIENLKEVRKSRERPMFMKSDWSKPDYQASYRWEESISEWVAKTPMPKCIVVLSKKYDISKCKSYSTHPFWPEVDRRLGKEIEWTEGKRRPRSENVHPVDDCRSPDTVTEDDMSDDSGDDSSQAAPAGIPSKDEISGSEPNSEFGSDVDSGVDDNSGSETGPSVAGGSDGVSGLRPAGVSSLTGALAPARAASVSGERGSRQIMVVVPRVATPLKRRASEATTLSRDGSPRRSKRGRTPGGSAPASFMRSRTSSRPSPLIAGGVIDDSEDELGL